MMRRILSLGSCLAVTLLVGCQDQATAPAISRSPTSARSVSRVSPSLLASMRVADLPSGNAAARAINPSDYPSCSDASPVTDWYVAEAVRVIAAERSLFLAVYTRNTDIVPTYEAIVFESSATPQYFGYNGEHTHTMVKAERDVKGFWDIPSADIQVLGMHGTILQDSAATAATYEVLGLYSPKDAAINAGIVRNALLASKTMNGGNHPYFTFNSVAFPGIEGWLPPKIVMGDGILAAYDALGFGDVAPEAIFAHEFAHQIQFANGYFEDAAAGTTGPEITRYGELMADAMSAYYLTHARGAAMNQKRVEQFLEVFYDIGDCAFGDDGHHGTPSQRMASARFGFEVASQAQKQGHILSSKAFHDLFVAKYPEIIAPESTR